MWELVTGALLRFIQERGDGAIALIFLLEEAGVPMPLPGDLVLIWAGYRVAAGQSALLTVLLAAELPTLLGASLLYWLARRGGGAALALVGLGRSTPHGAAFAPTAATLLLGAGVAWATAYAAWFEPRLRGPDWL